MVSTTNEYNGLSSWGYSSLAREFDLDRRTVKDRIVKSGINPIHMVKGFPEYLMRDAAQAILGFNSQDGVAYNLDPSKMGPESRAKHFDAELKKLKLAEKEFTVILADDYADDLAITFKAFVQTLDSLADVLTRDCGLSDDQFDRVQQICDEQRDILHKALADE